MARQRLEGDLDHVRRQELLVVEQLVDEGVVSVEGAEVLPQERLRLRGRLLHAELQEARIWDRR